MATLETERAMARAGGAMRWSCTALLFGSAHGATAGSAEVVGPLATARALRQRVDDLDVLIENARVVLRAQNQNIDPPPLSKTPVLDIIRTVGLCVGHDAGGVRVGSLLDQELRVMGITPKTHSVRARSTTPGLFHKKSGLQDVDNFVVVSHAQTKTKDYPIFENAPSWNGVVSHAQTQYVDRQYFIDAIEAEERGNPLRSVDELEQIEHFGSLNLRVGHDRIEELERPAVALCAEQNNNVDYLGLDLDRNSNAEIKAALEEFAQQEREAEGRGYDQPPRKPWYERIEGYDPSQPHVYSFGPDDEIKGLPDHRALNKNERGMMRDIVREWYRKNLQGVPKDMETEIGTVRFSAKGIGETLNSNVDPRTLRMLPAVKAIIEKGQYIGPEELHKRRKDNIIRFHRFKAPVLRGGKTYDVAVLVAEDSFGNLFYDLHSGLETETLGSPRSITLSSEGSAKGQKSFDQSETNSDSVVNIEVTTRKEGSKSAGRKQSPRGRVLFKGGDKPLIQLFEKADLSTYLHESGHVWLEEMIRDAGESPQVAADLKVLMDWMGVSDVKEIGTAQHEQFARGFEAYLREGKAPSLELQGAFGRFKAWLMRLYRSVRDLDVEVSDDVRGVMERMLATDAQIAEAVLSFGSAHGATARGVENSPVLDMTPEGNKSTEGAEVGKVWRDAVQEAKDRLLAQTLKSLSRERTAEWKKPLGFARGTRRAEVQAEVAQEVAQRRVYRAFNRLAKGRHPDGTKMDVPIKLWRAQLVAFYGEGVLKTLPRPYVYSKTGGLPIDVVAKKVGFGFEPDAMIEALQNMEPEQVVVERETDARMNERYGNPMTDGTLERDALEMVEHNRGAMIEQEIEALAKMTSARSLPAEAVGIYARQKIAQMRLSEATQHYFARGTRPHRFYRAEVKAAEQAAKAIAQGDLEGAFRAKQQQLLNHALYQAAKKERDTEGRGDDQPRKPKNVFFS